MTRTRGWLITTTAERRAWITLIRYRNRPAYTRAGVSAKLTDGWPGQVASQGTKLSAVGLGAKQMSPW
jgi:hypothetical protein